MSPVSLYRLAGWLLCTLLLWVGGPAPASAAYPAGIDLREWSPEAQPMEIMAGDWLLTWRGGVRPPSRVELPFTWHDGTPRWWGEVGFGEIELSTELRLPTTDEPLALYIDALKSAGRVWIDGELVAGVGTVGDAAQEHPRIAPLLVPLPPGADSVLVRIELSNHFHREGGIDMPILVGARHYLEHRAAVARGVQLFTLGGCILMALYLMLLGSWNDRQLLGGPFSMMLVLAALSAAANSGLMDNLELPTSLIYHIKYICQGLYPAIYALLLRRLFPQESSRRVTRLLLAVAALIGLLVLLAPPALFTATREPVALLVVGSCLFFLSVVVRAVRHGRDGAWAILLGMLLVTAAVCNDVLLYTEGVVTISVFPLGVLALLLSHGVVLGQRMLAALRHNVELSDRLQRLNVSLELRVEQRTEVLRKNRDLLDRTLEHMDAALLSVDGQGNLLAINQRFRRLFGVSGEAIDRAQLLRCLGRAELALSAEECLALLPPLDQPLRAQDDLALGNRLIVAVRRRALADGGWVATFEDVTRQRLAEQGVQGGDIGHWKLDLATRRLEGTARCWTLLGYEPHSLGTAALPALAHPQERGRLFAELRRARRGDGELHCSLRLLRAGGEWLWVSLRARCILDRKGRPLYWLGVVEDIDREVCAQQALEQARDQALRDARQTEELLATLSHELRTPLVAIQGHIALLLDRDDLPAPMRRRLDTVQDASRGLTDVLDGLLALARSESVELPRRVLFDFGTLAAECVEVMRLQASAKGLELTLQLELGERCWVEGSPVGVRQVLYNLLGNAIKFTERGGIDVRLQHSALGEGVVITITDTGLGIPEALQAQVFNAFTRLEQHSALPGVGLGLYIVQRLMQLMAGEIGLQSTPGVGSCFRLALPWPTLRGQGPASRSLDVPLDGLYVLLVEDVPVSREVTSELLLSWGCLVDSAGDGRDAIAACREHEYDLVLMDMRLPDMDGLQASRLIREGQGDVGPLMVALTANATDLDRQACLQAGLDGVLAKPLQRHELQRLLSGEDMFAPSSAELAEGDERSLAAPRFEQLRQWLGTDLFDRLLPSFIGSLDEVRSGVIELLDQPAGPRRSALLHRLQGSAANFGLHGLANHTQAAQRGEIELRALLGVLDEHRRLLREEMHSDKTAPP